MARLRNMSLKQSFFFLTLLCLLGAFVLSAAAFFGCIALRSAIAPGGVLLLEIGGDLPATVIPSPALSGTAAIWSGVLSLLQFLLPVVFVVAALFLANALFYRIKLKQPLAALQSGARKIIRSDLDFHIESKSGDELGQLCNAFETMRQELLRNNKELWRQAEERKRLNAAFSHDLRNPITVLKGYIQVFRMGIRTGQMTPQDMEEHLTRMGEYTERMETYVEAMSGVSRLEEVQCDRKPEEWAKLETELRGNIALFALENPYSIEFDFGACDEPVWIDKTILFNVVENLVGNACRYASSKIELTAFVQDDYITLQISDDGPGFPDSVLQKGPRPFLRNGDEQDGRHFGMGLYISRLLCEKHYGSMKILNDDAGARVRVKLFISRR